MADTPTACIVGRERGTRCLPVVPGSVYCAKHHPDRKLERSQEARRAALASHARRPDPELEAWTDSIDWSTDEGIERSLQEAAALVVKHAISAAEANAFAALARARRMRLAKAPTPSRTLVVETPTFTANGSTT